MSKHQSPSLPKHSFTERGQIVSLDFLIGAGVMLLAIGLLTGYAETNTYREKQHIFEQNLETKTEAALIAFSGNPSIACVIKDTNTLLAYSVDLTKATTIQGSPLAITKLKKELGLADKNVLLSITDTTSPSTIALITEPTSSHIYAYDMNVYLCTSSAVLDTNTAASCAQGTCTSTIIHQGTIHIEVS